MALDAPQAALEADMVIRYQVQERLLDALLRRAPRRRQQGEAPKLQLVRRAAIKQRTGEVWDNVALALSTARPSAGTAAPLLMPADHRLRGGAAAAGASWRHRRQAPARSRRPRGRPAATLQTAE